LQPTASTSAGPTIAECWAAINEYLTKFNGSQNNFTFLISYEELFFEGLLDDYSGAAAAYSLRRLDSGYTGDPIRVRRDGDNAEADIPFTSTGDLDTDALLAHCNNSKGYVKTWYDQSGNANDATQTTTGNQPMIVDTRTNLVDYSENFSASSWLKYVFNGASLTLTSGYEDPEGGNNAYQLDLIVGTGGALLTDNETVVTGVNYTLSVWMRGESGGEIVRLALKNNFSNGPSGSVITLTTEWTRYDVTLTADDVNRGFQFRLLLSDGASDQTIYIYGAQLEAGNAATAYIPTNGSAVTVAEVVTENGRPAMQFQVDSLSPSITNVASDYSFFSVTKSNVSLANAWTIDAQSGRLVFDGRGSTLGVYFDGAWQGTPHNSTVQQLNSIFAIAPTSGQSYINGSVVNTGLSYTQKPLGGTIRIGQSSTGSSNYWAGTMQEIVLYASDETTNRTGIEDNINDYYDIY
jgi:hypothetical protein